MYVQSTSGIKKQYIYSWCLINKIRLYKFLIYFRMSPGQFLNRFKIFILYMFQEKEKKMARKCSWNRESGF
jgi:hypothetical protein